MKLSCSTIALALIVFACSGMVVPSCRTQTKSQEDTRVIDSLPAPDDQAIRKILTADEWHNPFVIVDRDDYELILHDQPRLHLSLVDLEQSLLKMPRKEWPLGKVIAVSESDLRSIGHDDDAKITSNLMALKRMLESHKLRVDLWPA
jgi:hypothetical protein